MNLIFWISIKEELHDEGDRVGRVKNVWIKNYFCWLVSHFVWTEQSAWKVSRSINQLDWIAQKKWLVWRHPVLMQPTVLPVTWHRTQSSLCEARIASSRPSTLWPTSLIIGIQHMQSSWNQTSTPLAWTFCWVWSCCWIGDGRSNPASSGEFGSFLLFFLSAPPMMNLDAKSCFFCGDLWLTLLITSLPA